MADSLRSTPIVIRIAVDLNLVDTALAHERPMTAAELAEKSNADVELKRSDFSNAPKQPPPDVVQIVSLGLLVILDVFHRRQPGRQETTYHSRLWPRSRSRLAPQQRRAATIVLHASHGIHAVLLRAQRITKPPWTRGTGPFPGAHPMARDSVLRIHEVILLETGTGHFEAKLDWHLMNLGALKRTETRWRELVTRVGLRVSDVWWEEEEEEEEEEGTRGRRELLL
ncbi:hypothetical protein ST47_g1958 [Ascochyta rabiei]|uniref:Uncharacterized protein n=1 Tax=Didymella rabiei TaxID=5454 RepID=A0A163KB13_DIDRA|nr:hypothetical protein ST47_g1958 [Ascochyta rabiei]